MCTTPRKLNKIDKYLKMLCKKHNGNLINISNNSAYYEINGRVIRVSDHVGKNSSGNIHIIITDDNDYLLFYNGTNKMRVVNYEQVKDFCRSFFLISPMFCELQTNQFKFEMEVSTDGQKAVKDKDNEITKLKNALKQMQKKHERETNHLNDVIRSKTDKNEVIKKELTRLNESVRGYKTQIELLTEGINANKSDATEMIKALHSYNVDVNIINRIISHLNENNVQLLTA